MKLIITTSLIGLAIASSTSSASAKDWMEKVRISQGGIDQKVISVRANSNGYTTTTNNRHQFKLNLYAKAKSGKRIAFAEVGRPDVSVPEYDGAWSHAFTGREINSGTKRTWSRDGAYNVRLNQVKWNLGINPVFACNNLLQTKIQKGQSKSSVLSKTWTTQAKAHFGFVAAAAKPNVAKKGLKVNKTSTYTSEKSSYLYKVRVRCLPAPNHQNQVQQPQNSNGKSNKAGKFLNGALKATNLGLGIAAGFKGRRSSGRTTLSRTPGR